MALPFVLAAKDKNLPVVFLTASGDEYSVVAGAGYGRR